MDLGLEDQRKKEETTAAWGQGCVRRLGGGGAGRRANRTCFGVLGVHLYITPGCILAAPYIYIYIFVCVCIALSPKQPLEGFWILCVSPDRSGVPPLLSHRTGPIPFHSTSRCYYDKFFAPRQRSDAPPDWPDGRHVR
jgi:hypothetical protein